MHLFETAVGPVIIKHHSLGFTIVIYRLDGMLKACSLFNMSSLDRKTAVENSEYEAASLKLFMAEQPLIAHLLLLRKGIDCSVS